MHRSFVTTDYKQTKPQLNSDLNYSYYPQNKLNITNVSIKGPQMTRGLSTKRWDPYSSKYVSKAQARINKSLANVIKVQNFYEISKLKTRFRSRRKSESSCENISQTLDSLNSSNPVKKHSNKVLDSLKGRYAKDNKHDGSFGKRTNSVSLSNSSSFIGETQKSNAIKLNKENVDYNDLICKKPMLKNYQKIQIKQGEKVIKRLI